MKHTIGDAAKATASPHDQRDALTSATSECRNSLHQDKILLDVRNNRPRVGVQLLSGRFLLSVAVGVSAVGAFMVAIRLHGLTIERGVSDVIGSSKNADARVAFYQSLSGFVGAGVALLLEQYFAIVVAVMLVFFGNSKLFPGDTPRTGQLPAFKKTVLFCFTPLAMYAINIGLTSVFIEHKVTGVRRAFVDDNLIASSSLSQSVGSTSRIAANVNATSIYDTVLHAAVTRTVVPFQIDPNSKCKTTTNSTRDGQGANATKPVIVDVEATSVAYAFPSHNWYKDALPSSLEANHSIAFTTGNLTDAANALSEERRFEEYLARANVEWDTIHELLVQGLTQYSKSQSDSNAWRPYRCTNVDHLEDDVPNTDERFRRYNSSNDSSSLYAGQRTCYGGSALDATVDFRKPAFRNLATIMSAVASFRDNDTTISFATFVMSPQINLTTLTIDMPFASSFGYRIDVADGQCKDRKFINGSAELTKRSTFVNPEHWAQYEAEHCDRRYIAYNDSATLCGRGNCVFKDESRILAVKKELLMTPYMRHCDMTDLTYNFDIYAWLPNGCEPQRDSAFLYGMGSYMTGDFSANKPSVRYKGKSTPVVANARRHYVLSAAKMQWRFEDVSTRFGASCGVDGGCDGILHVVDTPQTSRDPPRVLVVGKEFFKSDFENHTLASPLILVALNTPKMYYGANDPQNLTYYTWERLDPLQWATNGSDSTDLGLQGDQCSLLIDAYLAQQEANHYYIEHPLQAMYTSAFFYLFQNAAVKEIALPANNTRGVVDLSERVIGYAHMKGDKEKKAIRYSIPLLSAGSTAIGIVIMLLYLAMMLWWPRDAVQLSDERHFSAQYALVLADDRYPESVHVRRLKLPNDDVVEMDDYAVETIMFYHPMDPQQRIEM